MCCVCLDSLQCKYTRLPSQCTIREVVKSRPSHANGVRSGNFVLLPVLTAAFKSEQAVCQWRGRFQGCRERGDQWHRRLPSLDRGDEGTTLRCLQSPSGMVRWQLVRSDACQKCEAAGQVYTITERGTQSTEAMCTLLVSRFGLRIRPPCFHFQAGRTRTRSGESTSTMSIATPIREKLC